MLVLSRKTNEEIIIGQLGEVAVCVLSAENGQVRLGFSAPKSVPIHRSEIFQKIQEEKQKTEKQ